MAYMSFKTRLFFPSNLTDLYGRHPFLFHFTDELAEASELVSGRTGLKNQV